MILEQQIISLEKVSSVGEYTLELKFNDKTSQVIDFYPFLSKSLNPFIRKYLLLDEFAKFEIENGDLEWNDYDLCFPIADLYENSII